MASPGLRFGLALAQPWPSQPLNYPGGFREAGAASGLSHVPTTPPCTSPPCTTPLHCTTARTTLHLTTALHHLHHSALRPGPPALSCPPPSPAAKHSEKLTTQLGPGLGLILAGPGLILILAGQGLGLILAAQA